MFICPWVYYHLDISWIYKYRSGLTTLTIYNLQVSLTKIYMELNVSNLQGVIFNIQKCKNRKMIIALTLVECVG